MIHQAQRNYLLHLLCLPPQQAARPSPALIPLQQRPSTRASAVLFIADAGWPLRPRSSLPLHLGCQQLELAESSDARLGNSPCSTRLPEVWETTTICCCCTLLHGHRLPAHHDGVWTATSDGSDARCRVSHPIFGGKPDASHMCARI
jgi:hypothetical protein